MQEDHFRRIQSPLSNRIEIDGQRYLYFGGTAYLGIPQNQSMVELYLQGVKHFGLNNGTSRSNNIQLNIYNEAEQFAAKQFSAEAALITSSGYLAAQLTIKALSKTERVRYAPATHPALWLNDAPQINGSFADWAKKTVIEINESKEKDWVIISNSINNLYPELYDFSFIEQINSNNRILLIVDDSHGIGVINQGKGAFSTLPKLKNIELVVIASMAKALGIDAGLILGSEKIIDQLKETHEFLGASPPSAAGLFAFINAAAIYKKEWEKLKNSTNKLANFLTNQNSWSFIPGFPVFLSTKENINEKLLQDNILISSFPYPDKDGDLINRIVLSSWHEPKDIEELILALHK
jgi:8-amino-7-oxononanoate synthase